MGVVSGVLTLGDATLPRELFLLLPTIIIYFTIFILYIYKIHERLSQYLKHVIEPELKKSLDTEFCELEEWFAYNKDNGIRKLYFFIIMWLITAITVFSVLIGLPIIQSDENIDVDIVVNMGILQLGTAFIIITCILVTLDFRLLLPSKSQFVETVNFILFRKQCDEVQKESKENTDCKKKES